MYVGEPEEVPCVLQLLVAVSEEFGQHRIPCHSVNSPQTSETQKYRSVMKTEIRIINI